MQLTVKQARPARSVWEHGVRLVLLRTATLSLLAGAVLFGQALAVQPQSAPFLDDTAVESVWTTDLAQEHPGCVAAADWPPNTWGASVIAVPQGRSTVLRIGFDEAWERSHNRLEADDLTVLGICAT